jgi:hypothetical protein
MADFGTILNPLNNTKDLYCNSINCNSIISYKIPYAFGVINNNLQITEQINYPIELVDTSHNILIDFSQSPKIIPLVNGIYEFNIVAQGTITDLSIPTTRGTVISIYANVYDASDNIVFTSPFIGLTCYLNNISVISNTFQTKFLDGYYIVFIVAPTSSQSPFTFLLSRHNVSMKYISS